MTDAPTHARIKKLEAKLATAIGALEMALQYNSAMHGGAAAYTRRIRDTIAELKGTTDG